MLLKLIIACTVMAVITNWILGSLRFYIGLIVSPQSGNGCGTGKGSGADCGAAGGGVAGNGRSSTGDSGSGASDASCSGALGSDGSRKGVARKMANEVAPWNDGGQCESGRAALWNDKGSANETRCCPTDKVLNNWAKGWCGNLSLESQCIFDEQCNSGKCSPGGSADGICVTVANVETGAQKKKSNEIAPWNDGGQCESGRAALWNDRGAANETRCCPTDKVLNNWAKGWCGNLLLGSQCIFDEQCSSGKCSPGISADGICVVVAPVMTDAPKKKSNEVAPWNDGGQCESGRAALWNDRGSANETRCCPTDIVLNNWAKGWCGNLLLGSQCIFDEQCSSGKCRPGGSADGICVNSDFGNLCGQHENCESSWCHAGRCK
jgi:hypothetical protein